MIKWISDFWLDYSASYYNRLKKYDREPVIDIFFHTSSIMSLNINTLLILFFKLINLNFIEKKYLIISTVFVFFMVYMIYNKMDESTKEILIKNRVPKYRWYFYRIYSLLSIIFFFITIYLMSAPVHMK